jgi:D-alanyl-D-alanine carboxypeptidase/D-alanyl-D-alanine-endopeptidase (penicillin-binding protein 4)
MKQLFRLALLILLFAFPESLCAQNLNSIIEEAPNQEAFWSVTVRDQQGYILERLNSKKVIIPASNQKLVTTAALLDHFGSDFRYETVIYVKGTIANGTLDGDLIIVGSGDPSLSGDLYDEDRYHVFDSFLKQLKEAGIQQITGHLIADVSLFDGQVYPKGWDWYDFSFYYGVQISPLSFNNNAVDLEVFADGEIGESPRISWFPDSTDYVTFVNKQVITHPNTEYDEYYRRELGGNIITLGSTLPQGYYEEESLSVEDPARYYLHTLRNYLNTHGVGVNGELMISDEALDTTETHRLAEHLSRPISELIEWANKESDNFYTEMMTKTLSAQKSEEKGSFEDGISHVREFLFEMGLDTMHIQMNDASGMAGGNFNTTENLSKLLVEMQSHEEFDTYYKSMSVAGIDGTLAHRMKGTPLYNNFKGKSGFVTGVRTLSGYMDSRSGKRIIVSIGTNNYVSEKVRPIDAVHEKILMYLYNKY